MTGTEAIAGVVLAVSYFLIGLSILSYGLSIFSVGETLMFIIFKKKSDDDDLLQRKDEDELEDDMDDEFSFDDEENEADVDDAQEDGSVYNTWFEVKRNSASDVFADYEVKNSAGQCNSYLNTCKAWFYGDVSASGPSGYGPNGDYSFISPSSFDRDGSGNMYGDDAAIDLRAAFEPILTCLLYTSPSPRDRG